MLEGCYSSLGILAALPVDVLKIDRGLIRNIHKNEKNLLLVKAILDITHLMSFETVAEGVEEELQYKLLKGAGCDVIQGWYFQDRCRRKNLKGFLERREKGMVTLDALKEFGANVEEGIARCAGSEALYLRLVGTIFREKSFDGLQDAVQRGDYKAAFEYAHALKGVLGNLSLTPLYEPTAELTELLRPQTPGDYAGRVTEILERKAKLEELCK